MKIVLCPNCYFDVKLEDHQYRSSGKHIYIKKEIEIICENCVMNVAIHYDIDNRQYEVKFRANDKADCYSPVHNI